MKKNRNQREEAPLMAGREGKLLRLLARPVLVPTALAWLGKNAWENASRGTVQGKYPGWRENHSARCNFVGHWTRSLFIAC